MFTYAYIVLGVRFGAVGEIVLSVEGLHAEAKVRDSVRGQGFWRDVESIGWYLQNTSFMLKRYNFDMSKFSWLKPSLGH